MIVKIMSFRKSLESWRVCNLEILIYMCDIMCIIAECLHYQFWNIQYTDVATLLIFSGMGAEALERVFEMVFREALEVGSIFMWYSQTCI